MSIYTICYKFKNVNTIQKPNITFAPKNVSLQNFSFLRPLINYIKKHPTTTPKLYINLLKSCKYFYSGKDLIIPLNHYARNEIWKIIVSKKKEPEKYKLPFKICLTEGVVLTDRNFFLSLKEADPYFIKYAFKCNIIKLIILGQNIAFKDFKFLTDNGVARFDCRRTTIIYENGTVVPIEKIFANLKNVEQVYYEFNRETAKLVSEETAKNLIKNIDTSKLETFYFYNVPEIFDKKLLKEFTDAHKNIIFDIQFASWSPV